MVSRRQAGRIVTHQVGHNRADSALLVVQHDRGAAGRAGAQLERTVRVLNIERLAVERIGLLHLQVGMFEKNDVGRGLPGHAFTDGTLQGARGRTGATI